ncbi:MAG: NAD-dependent epimerase/dehydratase family protein [Desulfobacteraceae bacterium]|nr:MAG: NAD-dependent epimerase/dehydratase family protein [Desulfobacteraceae bacterium]
MAGKKKKIVVTGGAGFIGSYVCESLLDRGWMVVAIDTSSGAKVEHLFEHPHFRFVQGSVTDPELMEQQMKDAGMIFHLAAIADPKLYVSNPLSVLQVDLKASIEIFRLAARYRTKVIFSSTSEIYGVNPNVPWKETDQRVLGATHVNRWCYSTAKAACEHYLFAHHCQDNLPFVIYRFFNVYGPRLDDLGHGRVMTMFLKNFLNDAPVEVHGDGSQTRSFLYVTDAVDAIVRLAFLKKAENQIFNIGTDQEVSVLELARLMKKIGDFSSPIHFVSHEKVFGTSYEDIPRRSPNVSKLKSTIRWQPRVSLEQGLSSTIEYYRKKAGIYS